RQPMALCVTTDVKLPPAIAKLAACSITTLQRERAAIDRAMQILLKEHATSALQDIKGLGPVFQATCLCLLPERDRLDRRQITRRVGVAPMNKDSGHSSGKRRIRGGRAAVRAALYMATLSAVRWVPRMK